jgi:hypothetical protein
VLAITRVDIPVATAPIPVISICSNLVLMYEPIADHAALRQREGQEHPDRIQRNKGVRVAVKQYDQYTRKHGKAHHPTGVSLYSPYTTAPHFEPVFIFNWIECFHGREEGIMDSINVVTILLSIVGVVAVTELAMWLFIVIRRPDYLRMELGSRTGGGDQQPYRARQDPNRPAQPLARP